VLRDVKRCVLEAGARGSGDGGGAQLSRLPRAADIAALADPAPECMHGPVGVVPAGPHLRRRRPIPCAVDAKVTLFRAFRTCWISHCAADRPTMLAAAPSPSCELLAVPPAGRVFPALAAAVAKFEE